MHWPLDTGSWRERIDQDAVKIMVMLREGNLLFNAGLGSLLEEKVAVGMDGRHIGKGHKIGAMVKKVKKRSARAIMVKSTATTAG